MQQFLKPAAGATGAEIIASKLFREFFLTVDDAQTFPDAGFGRETSATFACDLERTACVRVNACLPYSLRVDGWGCGKLD